MSLMLKLLATIAILASLSFADDGGKKVENFIKKSFSGNQNIKTLKVTVVNSFELKGHKGWTAYQVEMDAILKKDGRQLVQKMFWYTDGDLITKELFDVDTAKDMADTINIPFKDEFYKKENLISGSSASRHKVAIFSDPLCPFCKDFVPDAIEEMKKDPAKYAIYYYHFPLQSIHPASVELAQAAIAHELKSKKSVINELYKVNINPQERTNEKILAEFNKATGAKISMVDLMNPAVIKHFQSDLKIADEMLVNGTPTVFVDGILDRTKVKYKEVK